MSEPINLIISFTLNFSNFHFIYIFTGSIPTCPKVAHWPHVYVQTTNGLCTGGLMYKEEKTYTAEQMYVQDIFC